jgi:hypothetical protein
MKKLTEQEKYEQALIAREKRRQIVEEVWGPSLDRGLLLEFGIMFEWILGSPVTRLIHMAKGKKND